MEFTIQAVFSRSATLELCTDTRYNAPEGVRVLLDGVPVDFGARNVFSLHGLEPGMCYTVAVEQGGVRTERRFVTGTETALLDVRRFGAAGDGETDDTAKLQAAILACPAGGTVALPQGDYRCGPLFLKSNTALWLQKGARILGRTERAAYPVLPGMLPAADGEYNLGTWEGNPLDCFAALLTGIGVENVDIYGEGTVDGDAQNGDWWEDVKRRRGAWRPFLMFFNRCANIRVQGITLTNSYSWTLHPYYSRAVQIADVYIHNDAHSPNTDGIDPESCEDVEIVGCRISVGDDCIAIKSGKLYMARFHCAPTRRVTVRNCRMERGHGSIVIGSETSGGVYGVTVARCLFCGTDRGLRIKTRRGRGALAVLEDIRLENIGMENVLMPFTLNMFYFCDPDGHSPYVQSPLPLPADERTPRIGRITVKDTDCTGATASGGFFYGLPEQPVESITLENVNIAFAPNAAPEVPIMMDELADTERLGLFAKNVRSLVLRNVHMENALGAWPVTENVENLSIEET